MLLTENQLKTPLSIQTEVDGVVVTGKMTFLTSREYALQLDIDPEYCSGSHIPLLGAPPPYWFCTSDGEPTPQCITSAQSTLKKLWKKRLFRTERRDEIEKLKTEHSAENAAQEFEAKTYDGDMSHKLNVKDRSEIIKDMLCELERIWNENKAQRFCQLLYCLQRGFSLEHQDYGKVKSDKNESAYDLFYVEDKYFLEFLKTWKMTKFSAKMEYCSEPPDEDSSGSPGDAFLCSTPFLKHESNLPVNLILGQGWFWKDGDVYFLGVQNDSGKLDSNNLFGMTISDTPEIMDTDDKIELSPETIERVKNFVKTHKQGLMDMIDGVENYPNEIFGRCKSRRKL